MIYLNKVFKEHLSFSYFIKSGCLFLCLLLHSSVFSEINKTTAVRPFITTWKTDNPGTSATNQITIPTTGTGYNYSIYWESVSNAAIKGTATAITGNYTITFPAVGTYRLEISGSFPQIYFDSRGDRSKILSVDQWGSIVWKSMWGAFGNCNNLTVPAVDAPDLSKITDLSFMFQHATSMNQPIGHWDVSKVTKMVSLFDGATSFNQPIGNWNVSNVTDMSGMFASATNFNQDISTWRVDNVTNMNGMFSFAKSFNQNIGNWKVDNVTSMGQMFYEANAFNQDISSWKVDSVTNMRAMFSIAKSFNQKIGNWKVDNVTSMQDMFQGATDFNQDISNWNVSKVTHMGSMFNSASSFNQNISAWKVDNVTNMRSMFAAAKTFNQNIGNWNVSKVTDMGNMFSSAVSFNQPIGSWNVGNVTDMQSMFYYAKSFNQDIGNWDVSKAVNMNSIFSGATSFNQNIGKWNVSMVINFDYMFSEATSFNQDIGNWNVSKAYEMSGMFYKATSFNQDIDNWDIKNVTNISYLFNGATSFNKYIGSWHVSKVTDMQYMFYGATSFNQNIGTWDVSNVSTMAYMLNGSGLSKVNYDLTLKGWLANPNGIKDKVTLGAVGLIYCAGDSARKALIKDHTWTIGGDLLNCSQVITFGALEPKISGDAPFNLTGTCSSGQPVSYTSSNPAVATISGNIVTIVGAGKTTITASVPVSKYYTAVIPVQQILNVETITGTVNSDNSGIKIYPNPAKDYIEIDLDGKQINTLDLLDLNGKNVLDLNTTTQRVDISTLSKGVYILNVGTADKTIHYKIFKD